MASRRSTSSGNVSMFRLSFPFVTNLIPIPSFCWRTLYWFATTMAHDKMEQFCFYLRRVKNHHSQRLNKDWYVSKCPDKIHSNGTIKTLTTYPLVFIYLLNIYATKDNITETAAVTIMVTEPPERIHQNTPKSL